MGPKHLTKAVTKPTFTTREHAGIKGEPTMKTEQVTSTASKNVKNGAETVKADAPVSTETVKADGKTDGTTEASTGNEEKKTGGAVPIMPSAVVYKHEGKVFAAIHHPVDGTSYIQSGKGIGAAKGALEDAGFPLSTLLEKGPNWITLKVPQGATIIGYASVKGFPLPAQD